MLTYTYTARNATTGEKIKAQVQAENEQAAAKLIKAQGFTPVNIKLEKSGRGFGRKRIKTKDKVLFSRQMSTLINAGLPLVQSLRNVGSQTVNKRFKVVINQLISDVEAGLSFSDALQKHPTVFNRVFVSLIAAAETSGTLDQGLERLANQQEKDADIISKVRGAMIYPLIVLLVMIGVALFMIIKVLPQVQGIYAGIPGAELPLVTKALMGVSDFIRNRWYIVIFALAILIFAGSRWMRTMGGRNVVDKLKMRAWPIGRIFMKM